MKLILIILFWIAIAILFLIAVASRHDSMTRQIQLQNVIIKHLQSKPEKIKVDTVFVPVTVFDTVFVSCPGGYHFTEKNIVYKKFTLKAEYCK